MAFEDEPLNEGFSRTADIGDSLFNRFVIPFEVVSFVLLAALIGGIVLARKDPE
jgi:NADH-quinone oxidoreductase subunit J